MIDPELLKFIRYGTKVICLDDSDDPENHMPWSSIIQKGRIYFVFSLVDENLVIDGIHDPVPASRFAVFADEHGFTATLSSPQIAGHESEKAPLLIQLEKCMAVLAAARTYRAAEQEGTPREFKGKKLCDLGWKLDESIEAFDVWQKEHSASVDLYSSGFKAGTTA